MNKKEARALGFERGERIASWIDLPEIGQKVDKCIDWVGIGDTVDSIEIASEYFEILATETETADREYSPFEFTAHDINESRDPDTYWEEFDNGIIRGIRSEWTKRKSYYK